jgi:hypothetical protein
MPGKNLLLPSQQNWMFGALRGHGLDPIRFDWGTSNLEGESAARLFLIGTPYYFDVQSDCYYCRFSPGHSTLEQVETTRSWAVVQTYFAQWVLLLERELGQPDYWAMLQGERRFFSGATHDNSPFTPPEIERIKADLTEVKKLLREMQELTATQLTALDGKLDQMWEDSKRFGRKDWAVMVVGNLMSTFWSAALPPDAMNGVFRTVVGAISWAITGQPLLPP